MAPTGSRKAGIFFRKPMQGIAESGSHGLKQTLGPINLILLGVGCIIGAGIYVMTGTVAANFAGPAVILSFVVAGFTCVCVALCYAELAAAIPVAGASYTYCYAILGEVFAWSLGWLLALDYGLAGSMLAAGFAGYFVSLLGDAGIFLPTWMTTSYVSATTADGATTFAVTGGVNLVAAGAVMCATAILTRGVAASAKVNALLVVVKIAVLAIFVLIGIGAINPANWTPFVPENEGGFHFGWPGVLRGASILFFAYIGFETVSAAASETRNPQRAMPVGILGAVAVCTVVYIAVAAVMTGVVPFRELAVPDPIAVAVDRMGHPLLALLVKVGALMGLASVLLVNAYGQSRLTFSMSRDGLLPVLFSTLHKKFATPHLGTIVLGLTSALLAALLPIGLLGDLISLGTGLAFSVVCLSVIWLRNTRPELERPFRVPLGGLRVGGLWIGVIPTLAILLCWLMIGPVAIDIVRQAMAGDILPACIIGGYTITGALIYAFYGMRASRIAIRDAGEEPHLLP